jgi:probable rRNA maturation factor
MTRRSHSPVAAASVVTSPSLKAKASRLKPLPPQRERAGAQVHLGYAVPRAGLPSPVSFRRWVDAALQGAKRRKPAELAIRIVDADEGRALNRDYRGKDYATNVLSFPAELPPGVSLPLIGDLAICAPVVLREATEQGKAARDHWAHLAGLRPHRRQRSGSHGSAGNPHSCGPRHRRPLRLNHAAASWRLPGRGQRH